VAPSARARRNSNLFEAAIIGAGLKRGRDSTSSDDESHEQKRLPYAGGSYRTPGRQPSPEPQHNVSVNSLDDEVVWAPEAASYTRRANYLTSDELDSIFADFGSMAMPSNRRTPSPSPANWRLSPIAFDDQRRLRASTPQHQDLQRQLERAINSNDIGRGLSLLETQQVNVNEALIHAILCHNTTFVGLLIDTYNADVNRRDASGATPLFFVSASVEHPNSTTIVNILIDHGAQLEIPDNKGWTALYMAVRDSNLTVINALLMAGARAAVVAPSTGDTPLHIAAQLPVPQRLEIVRILIDHGAPLEVRNNNGLTPVAIAVAHGHLDIVMGLVQRGAHINMMVQGQTLVALARASGYREIANFLAERGAYNYKSHGP